MKQKLLLLIILILSSCIACYSFTIDEINLISNSAEISKYWDTVEKVYFNNSNNEKYKVCIDEYKNNLKNPLLSHIGILIIKNEIDVFDSPEFEQKIGIIPPKGLIVIEWTIFRNSKNELYIEAYHLDYRNEFKYVKYDDINILKELKMQVRYYLEKNTVHRIIQGKDYPFKPFLWDLENGNRYYSNDYSCKETFFWEEGANYEFDKNGVFLGNNYDYGYGR